MKSLPQLQASNTKLKNIWKDGEATYKGGKIEMTVDGKDVRIVDLW